MTKRIFRAIIVVAAAMLVACFVLILDILYTYFSASELKQLQTELSFAANGVEKEGLSYLSGLTNGDRLTWVGADGRVLFDSLGDAAEMENHAERSEIRDAMENGTGQSTRYSATLTEKMTYAAVRLSDGSVLRICATGMSLLSLLISMLNPIAAIFLAALIASFVLASRLAQKIVQPLNAVNPEHPGDWEIYPEIQPLLDHIGAQHNRIRRQKEALEERRREFSAIIQSMNEGLLLLGVNDEVMSMNPAAAAFFSADGLSGEGLSFDRLERDPDILEAVSSARREGSAARSVERGGRIYHVNITRTDAQSVRTGLCILVFDETEKLTREKSRREFTANVSHELKTPLQSIIGSAELLEHKLVRPEDEAQFIGYIRSESTRLVTLIDDILRLSHLDEQSELPAEDIDLTEVVKNELDRIRPMADERGLCVHTELAPVTVTGVRRLTHEVTTNLLENAVKYNVEGGSIAVCLAPEGGCAVLRVRDTGIGIPKEHLDRVFERFYRVDKSHSKRIGGTGLGLSIVKHAVACMNGTVDVESEVGKGSTFTVTLPLSEGI